MFETEIYSFAEAGLGGECEKAETLNALCAAASAEIVARLRQGVEPESIKELFVTAAGVLALSMYIALGEGGSGWSFKAGNLAVSRSGSGYADADALRRQAEAMLAAYLVDQGFDFRSVEG